MSEKKVKLKNGIIIGAEPVIISGPCVIESESHALMVAEKVKQLAEKNDVRLIFKTSYDKANRTSIHSYRGPGLSKGLDILEKIKEKTDLPLLIDVHKKEEVDPVAEVADILQIPAFLCRQTDLIIAAARTGKPVNIKKGQFIAPWDVENIIEKLIAGRAKDILITERGTTFGYNNLVVDPRSFYVLKSFGYPVVFDATHSVQLPGAAKNRTAGQREFIPTLVKAAAAAGVDALFLEVHDCPDEALCDGTNMLPLEKLEKVIDAFLKIRKVVDDLEI